MTYRVVHVIYIVSAIVFWLATLETLRTTTGLLPGVDAWWATSAGATITTFLVIGGMLLYLVAWAVAAMIVWRFRSDWKAVLPAALYLIACLAFLVSMLAAGDVNENGAKLFAVLLALFGLSATWVARYWYTNGYPSQGARGETK